MLATSLQRYFTVAVSKGVLPVFASGRIENMLLYFVSTLKLCLKIYTNKAMKQKMMILRIFFFSHLDIKGNKYQCNQAGGFSICFPSVYKNGQPQRTDNSICCRKYTALFSHCKDTVIEITIQYRTIRFGNFPSPIPNSLLQRHVQQSPHPLHRDTLAQLVLISNGPTPVTLRSIGPKLQWS